MSNASIIPSQKDQFVADDCNIVEEEERCYLWRRSWQMPMIKIAIADMPWASSTCRRRNILQSGK